MWWNPALLGMVKHLSAPGKWGMNFLFDLLVWATFALVLKLSLSWSMSFLPFPLLILSSIPLYFHHHGTGCVGFSCWLGLNRGHILEHPHLLDTTGQPCLLESEWGCSMSLFDHINCRRAKTFGVHWHLHT